FHLRHGRNLIGVGWIQEDVAGGTRQRATAFGDNAFQPVADCGFHDRVAFIGLKGDGGTFVIGEMYCSHEMLLENLCPPWWVVLGVLDELAATVDDDGLAGDK